MPTYTFACECGHEWDVVQPMAEATHKKQCPGCGKTANRLYKPPSVLPDSFAKPRDLSSIYGGKAESRSDVKRAMSKYDRKFGTKLVEA